MAVFREEHTHNYMTMSNQYLRDKQLSLKAKGLLSMMLSLPDDWNYSIRGLSTICKDGVDAIRGAIRELEAGGYVVRSHKRGKGGRIEDIEYMIYEEPVRQGQSDQEISKDIMSNLE